MMAPSRHVTFRRDFGWKKSILGNSRLSKSGRETSIARTLGFSDGSCPSHDPFGFTLSQLKYSWTILKARDRDARTPLTRRWRPVHFYRKEVTSAFDAMDGSCGVIALERARTSAKP